MDRKVIKNNGDKLDHAFKNVFRITNKLIIKYWDIANLV